MSDTLSMIIKFVLTVLLFPILWASSVEFHQHIVDLPRIYGDFFFWGMFGFTLLSLFFYQFWGVYEFGQKTMSGALQFAAPANHFIAKIIPFYLSLILLGFYITDNFLDIKGFDHYFMFFAGFTFTMHIILTAQDLQESEKSFIKPGYLFLMMIVCILTVCVTVLLIGLVLGKFTFPDFFRAVVDHATDIYYLSGKKVL